MELSFSEVDQRRLTKAALLHDIGKVAIPLKILNKPGPLDRHEIAVIRTHTTIGHQLLLRQNKFHAEQLDVVLHHEYLDGSGYPDGLGAAQIPDIVRMVTICDIYAALLERRAYREEMAPALAFQTMEEMRGKIDFNLLAAFKQIVYECDSGPLTRH